MYTYIYINRGYSRVYLSLSLSWILTRERESLRYIRLSIMYIYIYIYIYIYTYMHTHTHTHTHAPVLQNPAQKDFCWCSRQPLRDLRDGLICRQKFWKVRPPQNLLYSMPTDVTLEILAPAQEDLHTHTGIYVYVRVNEYAKFHPRCCTQTLLSYKQKHTHTYIYIYMYAYRWTSTRFPKNVFFILHREFDLESTHILNAARVALQCVAVCRYTGVLQLLQFVVWLSLGWSMSHELKSWKIWSQLDLPCTSTVKLTFERLYRVAKTHRMP